MAAADAIAKALGGRKAGTGWIARCPAHDDRNPSLSLSTEKDGKVLLRCHAGCGQAQVIDALRARGLWEDRVDGIRAGLGASNPTNRRARRRNATIRTGSNTRSASGGRQSRHRTPWPRHICNRVACASRLPRLMRFHSGLKHPSGRIWPTMVALVSRGPDDAPLAVHRTFLTRDGFSKAPVDPQKMMLGPCRGGAVRLTTPTDLLMVGEGIETCAAAMQVTGNPAWAALSTSGLRGLDLPESVREVIVLADGDDPGEAAARDCALRWRREGRRVRIARPLRGQDFNDMLTGRAPRNGEGRK